VFGHLHVVVDGFLVRSQLCEIVIEVWLIVWHVTARYQLPWKYLSLEALGEHDGRHATPRVV
jgi:hypothetical protein